MTSITARAILALLLIFFSIPALTQEPRAKIGLVLSGGGARGAAHIGVIRVLEQMQIPIDYIAGSSMGAVVGGLYASGKTAAELTAIVDSIDWADNFNDDPVRKHLSFRRKQDDRDFLVDFDIGVGTHGFEFPRGLVQGQKLNLLLKSQTTVAEQVSHFDNLPIPYRAVATDIESGEAVVLEDGSLATAMRASMAVPGLFTPVERRGRLLVDGGISNNLPVNVAREMGADILIVVDIQFPLQNRDQLDSALDVTNQLLTILVLRESRAQLKTLSSQDIVIVPQLGRMGSSQFELASPAIELGAASALEKHDSLKHLSLSAQQYEAHLAARDKSLAPIAIEFVDVLGSEIVNNTALAAQIKNKSGGLDLARLDEAITRLYGLDVFELIDYELVKAGDQTGLAITVRDKSWGPEFVNLGTRLSDDLEGTSSYTLGFRYTRMAANTLGAEWRTDLQIGTNPRLLSELYQPLDQHWRWFVAGNIELERFNADLFEGDRRTAQFLVSTSGAGFDFGRAFGNWGEMRVGVQRTRGRIRGRISALDTPTLSFDRGEIAASFALDTLDNTNFPRSGWQSGLSWSGFRKWLGSDQSLNRVQAASVFAHSFDRHTFVAAQRAGTNLGGSGAIQDLYSLGGLFNLSGLRNGQLTGQHFAVVDLVYYSRLNPGSSFNMPVYAGVSLEMGNTWDNSDAISGANSVLAGSLFLGIDTFVGPIYLAYGLAEGGQAAAYFLLGAGF